jgi:hypothetical protein
MEYTMAENVPHVLRWGRWRLILTQDKTATHETMRTLLTYFMEDALKELNLTRTSEPSTSLTARALNWLAKKLQTDLFVTHAKEQSSECMARAQHLSLLTDIALTAERYYRTE